MADPVTRLSGKERSNATNSSSLIDAKLEEHQISGSKVCPSCGHKFEFKEGIQDWPGLPAGVKFDPTDQELLEHLEAKIEINGQKPHPLIDEFIPTLEGEDGICYTHPEKLPGVTRDGLNRHFFHRPSKAYTTGTRKRRKIQSECDLQGGETRWHKTGKTRPVSVNGKQKGCKKILVLYTNFGKHRKPEKTNWVMHQYHLGLQEEEKEGELVVSKVFYQTQPRQCNWERATSDLAGSVITRNKNLEMSPIQPVDGSFKTYPAAAMVEQAMTDINPGPSCAYNVEGVQQINADQFPFGSCPRSFDEGISDSTGKGSESSHCTPHSCDEHEEHEHDQQMNAINDALKRGGFPMSSAGRHDMIALHFNKRSDNAVNVDLKSSSSHHHHGGQSSNADQIICRAGESQEPDQDGDLAALDESLSRPPLLIPHEKLQNVSGKSSSQKLSFEDMFMESTGIKEEAALTNSQDSEWLKYSSSFWPESDSPENSRMI